MSEREAWQVTDDAALLYEQSFVPAIFAGWAPLLADVAAVAPGDRVLDVGCGTGVLAREVARRAGPQGRVIGLDLNPRMLAVARSVEPGIEWQEGEAGHLPFGDGAFDAVVSQFALMFFPDPVEALREMWRVLAPGGRLAVAVCGPLEDAPGYAALTRVGERTCTREVVELLRSPFALGDRNRLSEIVGRAGIAGAAIDSPQRPVRFSSIEALVHTEVRASPIRDVIDEASLGALVEGARASLAPLRRDDGEVGFPLTAHVVSARKA